MPVRTNAEGLLEILHPETGAYVPASALLQVEGGWLAALVPNQVAMLSDIRAATTHLELIENVLLDVQSVLAASNTKLAKSNTSLDLLPQINAALGVVNNAIDSLEALAGNTNNLLQGLQAKTDQLSGKLPAALGAKLRTESLSVALATDSTIFASLANLLTALTDGGANSVYSSLVALSNKLPASVGGKLNASSLSVALATDSTIFASLASIISALSSGGTNTTGAFLSTIAAAQFWTAPSKINSSSPVINAVTAAVSSAAYSISSQTEALSVQNFFSAAGLSAQFAIELRLTAGATSLSDKTYYYRGDVATPFAASAGVFPGESPIIIPTYGYAQVVVNLYTISGGNVTTYLKEIR
ncbi:hypothetical protein QT972_27160 [Microcoleus sp. herbarium7]|uniref:hypothetical protein n=1 Tax=Microcoleus sp. herbarium7 TaxID=3055435 RepID=UPI002FD4E887